MDVGGPMPPLPVGKLQAVKAVRGDKINSGVKLLLDCSHYSEQPCVCVCVTLIGSHRLYTPTYIELKLGGGYGRRDLGGVGDGGSEGWILSK